MDDSFQDLEAELKRLRPRTPSAGLLSRLERELAGPDAATDTRPSRERRSTPVGTLRWVVWPAAAALVVLGGIAVVYRSPADATRSPAPFAQVAASEDPAGASFKPVGATKFLYETLDEGPVMLSDGLPARRVCNRYVDTYTWRNPRTRASVQWIVPRAEVRVVPVEAF
jgi:hypothetical protein